MTQDGTNQVSCLCFTIGKPPRTLKSQVCHATNAMHSMVAAAAGLAPATLHTATHRNANLHVSAFQRKRHKRALTPPSFSCSETIISLLFRARIFFITTITREYQLNIGRDASHGTCCVQGVHVLFSLRAFRNVSKFMALYSFEPQSYGSHKIASLSSFFVKGLQDGGVASRQTESQDQC